VSPPALWSEPVGAPGTIEVVELVRYADLARRTKERPDELVELSATEVAGRQVACGALGWRRIAAADGDAAVELDLQRLPDEVDVTRWRKSVELFGEHGEVTLESDREQGSRLRGPLRFLRIDGAGVQWCWHFVGGRAAGERLVLVRGDLPGGEPVVTTYPAQDGRSLGNPTGGAAVDRHVTSWAGEASFGEIVLAELLATSRLGGLVDYRAARVVEGTQELIGYAPRAEGNTE
jgi:hypothetical protein